MLRTIVLHGALGERFGGPFQMDVASPAEALRALIVQLKGFRQHIRDGHYRVIRKRNAREEDLDESGLRLRLGTAKELHIVPVVVGAGGRGIGKILVGVALIAASFLVPGLAPFAANIAFGVGASLALGGVSQLLATAPKTQGGSAEQDQRQSFLFGGQVNVSTQGGPVPAVYGRFTVGSVLISVGLAVEQLGSDAQYFTPEQIALRVLYSGKGGG